MNFRLKSFCVRHEGRLRLCSENYYKLLLNIFPLFIHSREAVHDKYMSRELAAVLVFGYLEENLFNVNFIIQKSIIKISAFPRN
jgi:hypothetical protein